MIHRATVARHVPEPSTKTDTGQETPPELAIRVVIVPPFHHVVKAFAIAYATFLDLATRVHCRVPVQFHVRRGMSLAEVGKTPGTVIIGSDVPHDDTQAVEILDVLAHPREHLVSERLVSVVGNAFLHDRSEGQALDRIASVPMRKAVLGKVVLRLRAEKNIVIAACGQLLPAYFLETAVSMTLTVERVVLVQDILDARSAVTQHVRLYHIGGMDERQLS